MPFYLLGRDGYFVPRPIRMEELILGPGQRVSSVVVGGPGGRYAFRSMEFKFDELQPPLPEVDLGTVVSEGPLADIAGATGKVAALSHFRERRTRPHFLSNGKVFDENRTDVTVKLGDTEEWTIRNEDSQYHDFHIHQTRFLVTEVNGEPAQFDGLRDTYSVPPGRNGKAGDAKLIIPFTNPEIVGWFVFHCHVVKHEDKGMMMAVEVTR